MKNAILLFAFAILPITNLQAQGWEWTNASGSSNILKDSDDNLYVITNHFPNFVIEKIDLYGNPIWTRNITGNAFVTGYQMDNANNLVLVGNFTAQFIVDSDTLTPHGTQSFFILKLSPTSVLISANAYGSTTRTFACDLFINLTGEYLIGGGFTGAFDINGDSIAGDSFFNAFILKTDENQNLIWAEKSTMYTSSGESYVKELEETTSGNIYATIVTSGGLAEINGYQFSASSGKHIFFMDTSRNVLWSDYLDYPGVSHNTNSDLQSYADSAYMKEYIWSSFGTSYRIHRWTSAGVKSSRSFTASSLGYDIAFGKIFYGLYEISYGIPAYNKTGTLTLALIDPGDPVDTTSISPKDITSIQCISPFSFYAGTDINVPFVGKYVRTGLATVVSEPAEEPLKIYPNPTEGNFTLEFSKTQVSQNEAEICIFDVFGNCVKKQNLANATNQQLDISGMSKGIYFVEVGSTVPKQKIILN